MKDGTGARPHASCPDRRAAGAPWRWRLALGTALAAIVMVPVAVRAQAGADTRPQGSNPVGKVVAGIVSYTRWPSAGTAIRLCTVGRGQGIDALLRSNAIDLPGRAVSIAAVADLETAAQGCDALYLGRASAELVRQAVKLFAGRPVLLLGEGSDFCSDGGMFCLEPAADTPRFGVNLDAVARSGLRVNPLVLRIARGGDGTGP